MEKIVLKNSNDQLLMTVKFAALQKMTAEYYMAIEDELTRAFELQLSTKYAARFTANRQMKKKMEKEMKEHMDAFKARSRAFKQKNNALYDHMEMFRAKEYQVIESAVEQIYDYIDKLIIMEKDAET